MRSIFAPFAILLLHPAQTLAQPDLQIAGRIVFASSLDDAAYEIYTMNADGTGVARLTSSSGTDSDASWSPDGSKVIFYSNRDDGNHEIYVMNADGSNQVNLTNHPAIDYQACWSPDGSKIAYTSTLSGGYEIHVMNADGSNPIRSPNGGGSDYHPSWSPDGTKIAFASDRDGNVEIYVTNADGSNLTRLTNNPAEDAYPSWSPDGTKIAFRSRRDNGNGDIFVMNADGTNQTRLTDTLEGGGFPSWSPDGTKIAFVTYRGQTSNTQVFVMNADGSGQTALTDTNFVLYDRPSWGEAFRRIGATSIGSSVSRTMTIQNKGNATLTISNITSSDGQFTVSRTSFNVNAGASQDVTVTFNPTSAGTKYATLTIASNDPDAPTAKLIVNGTGKPPPAPDLQIAGKIAYSSGSGTSSEIYVANADGTGQTRLTNNSAVDDHPAWSPDGNKIAFHSGRDGGNRIYVMNADGTDQVRLTNDDAEEMYPTWSPDGGKILFFSSRDGDYEVYVMNADGTGQAALTDNPADDAYATWSPDGSKIVFYSSRDGNNEIYLMNADGTGQTRLTNDPAPDVGPPSWSSDGSKIAFISLRDGNSEIYTMNADGTGQTRLTNNSGEDVHPAWSPEGSRIAFSSIRNGNNYEIHVMNADGTNQIQLPNSTAYDSAPSWGELARHIGATSIGSPVSRTMAIENKGSATLTISNITSSDGQFTVSPTSFSVNAGASRDVTATFTPSSAGTKYTTLTITSNDPDAGTVNLIVNGAGVILGDANLDGSIGIPDAILVLRFAVDLETPTLVQRVAADVNRDGQISSADAILILRCVVGIDCTFPKPAGVPPVVAQLGAALSNIEYQPDGTLALAIALDRKDHIGGGDLIFTYGAEAGRVSDVQLEGLSSEGLSIVNATVPGEVRVSFVEPGGGPEAGQVVLHILLPGAEEAEAVDIGLTGRFYDSRGLPVGEVRLDRTVSSLPTEYALLQNYPNPFNPATTIGYDLPEAGHVVLEIYSVAGQLMRRLVDRRVEAGRHTAEWDGMDNRGRKVSSGIYLYRLTGDGGRFAAIRRMVFLK